jgi:coenzyme F420-dependent glucose-6-phosphate dehydrogenase
MLTLTWKAGTEQYPPDELLQYALAAEKAGFDAVAASDHFHPWAEKGQACFVWSWLGAVAARSKKLALGTGVTCPILRYHPAVIAQAAATIASLAPGGFFLGVGTGEALNEYATTGEWPEYKDRRERMAEAIGLMRELWTGEAVTHRGAYYETHKAKLYTRPTEPIPIYISSLVPESAHFAGLHGDGLVTVAGEEPKTYREIMKSFEAGAREAGKNPSKMPRVLELGVAFTDDEEEAVESRKEYWAGVYIPAMFTERIYTPEASEENGKVVGDEVIAKSICISSDPDEHIQYAQRYIDMGFNHLCFHSAGPDQLGFIEAYGKEVLPGLRQGNQRRAKRAA